jgi:serine/threonine-protein kinase RsbT
MALRREQVQPVQGEEDVVRARQIVREWANELRFSLVDQTKLVTAVSELARNTLTHGGGGTMRVDLLTQGIRTGLRITFEDQGPGIPNIELAMRDGYTTGGGLGLGLGGAKRLVNDFQIESKPGTGTRVSVTRWH